MYDVIAVNPELLDPLLSSLCEAKETERRARDARIAVENQIIQMVGTKGEGSRSVNAMNYKVKLVSKLSRRVDWDQYDQIVMHTSLPPDQLPVKFTRAVDVKKLETLQQDYPDLYKEIERCITVTPQKVQVSIEQIKG